MLKSEKPAQTYESLAAIAVSVFHELSAGFTENIYHKAFVYELQAAGISHETEKVIPINYKSIQVGYVRCDLLIENNILVEFKSVQNILPQHLLQLERYAAQLDVEKMLLVNFPIHKSKPLEIHAFVKDCFEKIHP